LHFANFYQPEISVIAEITPPIRSPSWHSWRPKPDDSKPSGPTRKPLNLSENPSSFFKVQVWPIADEIK
jgi:hypothetical protein